MYRIYVGNSQKGQLIREIEFKEVAYVDFEGIRSELSKLFEYKLSDSDFELVLSSITKEEDFYTGLELNMTAATSGPLVRVIEVVRCLKSLEGLELDEPLRYG